jgi:6-phosphogluconolactonase
MMSGFENHRRPITVRFTLLFAAAITSIASSTLAARPFVYVSIAGENKISVFALSKDGKLTHRLDVQLPSDPGALATSPDRRFVFSSMRSKGKLTSFRLDPKTGGLAKINVIDAAPDPAFVATDRTGKFLLTAYYVAGKAAVHLIAEDGSLDAKTARWTTTADKAHAILTDPSNRFAFVPHTGPNRIFQFRFDSTAGKLIANDPPSLSAGKGHGPRQLYFHPRRPFVYFDNEQGSSVTAYRMHAKSGTLTPIETLSTLSKGYAGSNSCARLAGTHTGKFLYAANRGDDTIAGFAIDEKTGRLTSLGTFKTERTPRGFAISPDDRFLVAAGQSSKRLAVYRIRVDGRLEPIGTYAVGKAPWWVMIVDPDRPAKPRN